MAIDSEFDHAAVPPERLQPARYFAASYAGEHIAGTEFVIGAAFVAWGASAGDVILGLIIGNFLAVMTWALICAPVAVETRLTLYAYLEKIAGPAFIKIYSLINGVMFAILAGSMITVSASAVRIPLGIAPQTNWYPTDPAFVAVAIGVGAVVVTLAVLGFKRLAQFAALVVPWMVCMFLCGALALLPVLVRHAGFDLSHFGLAEFWAVLEREVYVKDPASSFTLWHVAAFAWVCNLAMHGSLGDMTLLRFAPKASYGYFSALGMFVGHFAAWIAAGVMGVGAALIIGRAITELDPGEVAYQALGAAGVLAVIVAGWTTSNPTLYRAGLAFQSINPRWSRAWVTAFVGVVTTIIACFPFVFTQLLNFVGLMGLTLAPVGAVIIAEHWIFPRIGLTRYWRAYQGAPVNVAAILAWAAGLISAYLFNRFGLHLFFLLIPTWLIATATYVAAAALSGAAKTYPQAADAEADEAARKAAERSYLAQHGVSAARRPPSTTRTVLSLIAYASLGACLWLSLRLCAAPAQDFAAAAQTFKAVIMMPTAVFFAAALAATLAPKSAP